MNLPHPDIGLDVIQNVSVLVNNLIAEVVQERILGTPCLDGLERKHGHTAVSGRDGLLRHRLLWRGRIRKCDPQSGSTFAIEQRTDNQLLLVDVSVDLNTLQAVLGNRLHPHGLPYSRRACIFTIVGSQNQGLLSGWLPHPAKVALGIDHQVMGGAGSGEISDVIRE